MNVVDFTVFQAHFYIIKFSSFYVCNFIERNGERSRGEERTRKDEELGPSAATRDGWTCRDKVSFNIYDDG